MTQVWMLRNSDTDIHVFNRFEHLLPSVKISYSRCIDVQIEQSERTSYEVTYRVTGKRVDKAQGEEFFTLFDETIQFKCLPVWTEPCQL